VAILYGSAAAQKDLANWLRRHRESIPDFQSRVFGVLINADNRELEEVGYLVE
jgi:hypothetical protein